MGCTVRLLEEPRCIEVRGFDVVTADDVATALRLGLALASEHDVWLVLTDVTETTGDPSIVTLFEAATELEQVAAGRRYRQALVAPTGAASLETARFYEDAMVNRGLMTRVFGTRADAEAWLAEQARDLRP